MLKSPANPKFRAPTGNRENGDPNATFCTSACARVASWSHRGPRLASGLSISERQPAASARANLLAQSAAAFGWGPEGRWFKSSRPDYTEPPLFRRFRVSGSVAPAASAGSNRGPISSALPRRGTTGEGKEERTAVPSAWLWSSAAGFSMRVTRSKPSKRDCSRLYLACPAAIPDERERAGPCVPSARMRRP
jgi:hypothetical protein